MTRRELFAAVLGVVGLRAAVTSAAVTPVVQWESKLWESKVLCHDRVYWRAEDLLVSEGEDWIPLTDYSGRVFRLELENS